jgi:hypothetical protein
VRIASILDRGRHGASAALIAAVIVAACSPAASPSPSPTTAPTPAPTVAPTASVPPSPSAAAVASPSAPIKDPTVDLKIAAPYELTALDPATEAAIRGQIAGSLGAFGGIFDIGVRQVTDNGQMVGFVMAMGFPSGVLTEGAYKGALAGLASSLGITFATTDVNGTTLSSASNATAGYAAYQDGDNLMFVISPPTGAKPDAIASALIAANP